MQRRRLVLVYLAKFIRIKAFYHSLKKKHPKFDLNKHKRLKAAGRNACYTIIKMINDVFFSIGSNREQFPQLHIDEGQKEQALQLNLIFRL